jgi:hypothetical protein
MAIALSYSAYITRKVTLLNLGCHLKEPVKVTKPVEVLIPILALSPLVHHQNYFLHPLSTALEVPSSQRGIPAIVIDSSRLQYFQNFVTHSL